MPIKFSILKCLLLQSSNEVVGRYCLQLPVSVCSRGPSSSPPTQGPGSTPTPSPTDPNLFNLNLTVQGPLDMFKLGPDYAGTIPQLPPPPPRDTDASLDMFKLVQCETWTVDKRAVDTRLKFLLVSFLRFPLLIQTLPHSRYTNCG